MFTLDAVSVHRPPCLVQCVDSVRPILSSALDDAVMSALRRDEPLNV